MARTLYADNIVEGPAAAGQPAVGNPILIGYQDVSGNVQPFPVPAGGGGGGAATIADGADVAEGAKADAAWTSGSGSVIALLKAIAAVIITKLVVTSSPLATGGTSTYSALGGSSNALLTNSAVQVGSAAAHSLYGVALVNRGAADAFVQVFDLASGSVTLGTTVPKLAFWVPAGGAWEEKWPGESRILFGTGIAMAATTTATGNAAPATGIQIVAEYL